MCPVIKQHCRVIRIILALIIVCLLMVFISMLYLNSDHGSPSTTMKALFHIQEGGLRVFLAKLYTHAETNKPSPLSDEKRAPEPELHHHGNSKAAPRALGSAKLSLRKTPSAFPQPLRLSTAAQILALSVHSHIETHSWK